MKREKEIKLAADTSCATLEAIGGREDGSCL